MYDRLVITVVGSAGARRAVKRGLHTAAGVDATVDVPIFVVKRAG